MKAALIATLIIACLIGAGIFIGHTLSESKKISRLDSEIKKKPKSANAYRQRSNYHYRNGDYEQAASDLTQAMELSPDDPWIANDLAWFLSVCPDENYRDGERAVILAQKAVEKIPNPATWDTLAAAYAERGEFKKAVSAQEKAISLLKKKEMLSRFEERLHFYQSGKPWRTKE